MKTIQNLFAFAFVILVFNTNAQEKKIKFNKGILEICSSKNFQIEGYDGDEVIIKALHENKSSNVFVRGSGVVNGYSYKTKSNTLAKLSKKNDTTKKGAWVVEPGVTVIGYSEPNSKSKKGTGSVVFYNDNSERKEGLKKLGNKNNDADLGIYFTIEQFDNKLYFKDKRNSGLVMVADERYEIKIPNSIKLNWYTQSCEGTSQKNNTYVFYNSKASTLSNFDGEVSISSTLNHTELTDVTGPVSINTVGGNVTVKFDKKIPTKLYSIYTNNGFIDMEFPKKSNLTLYIEGKSIYSDMDFEILGEKEIDDAFQKITEMKLKSGSGKVNMKLYAGFGEVFLREKK